ncbi:hypothetical protein ACWERW_27165 [Streptomyces sp. NPDC004012]
MDLGQDWRVVDLAQYGGHAGARDDGLLELGCVHGVQPPVPHGPAARTAVGLGGRRGDQDGAPHGAAFKREHEQRPQRGVVVLVQHCQPQRGGANG